MADDVRVVRPEAPRDVVSQQGLRTGATRPGRPVRATAEPSWRCFFCDEVFTRREDAAEHFGVLASSETACRIKAHEGHIVHALRKAEEELARYRAEDSDLMRSILSLEATNAAAIRCAEEKGYDRGVRDALEEIERAPEELRDAIYEYGRAATSAAHDLSGADDRKQARDAKVDAIAKADRLLATCRSLMADRERVTALAKLLGTQDLSLIGTAHGRVILTCESYPELFGADLRDALDLLKRRMSSGRESPIEGKE